MDEQDGRGGMGWGKIAKILSFPLTSVHLSRAVGWLVGRNGGGEGGFGGDMGGFGGQVRGFGGAAFGRGVLGRWHWDDSRGVAAEQV